MTGRPSQVGDDVASPEVVTSWARLNLWHRRGDRIKRIIRLIGIADYRKPC
jgi:hypothetical protein